MRYLLFIFALGMMPMSAMAIMGGKAPGESCSTTTDAVGQESTECFTGNICVVDYSTNTAYCIPDCKYIENTEDIPLYVFNMLMWESYDGVSNWQSLCATSTVHTGAEIRYAYRCPLDQFGRPTDATTGCTQCPGNGSTNTTSNSGLVGGFTVKTCILRNGRTASDATGTFTVTADCPWVE